MRRVLLVCGSLGLAANVAVAGFTVPQEVFRVGQLANARALASREKKALTFMFSDAETTCPLCTGASTDVLSGLRAKSVLVYVDSKGGTDWKALPKAVQKALASHELGKFIPKTVVMDADAIRVIAYVPYMREADERIKLIAAAKKKIEAELVPAATDSDH